MRSPIEHNSIIVLMTVPSELSPRSIYSTRQVREFDRTAIEKFGIDSFELMRRAAAASLQYLQRRWPNAKSLIVYCGAGNNAGDGYVLASFAADAGLKVRIVAMVDPSELRGDAAKAYGLAVERNLIVELNAVGPCPTAAIDLAVDALLGTGLSRDVDGAYAAVIDAINS